MRSLTRPVAALAAAALVVCTGLLVPGRTQASVAASSAVPGVTSNQILIGTSLPQSGIAAAYKVIANGEQAYIDDINAHGGVHGRKIKLMVMDDQYNPANTLANVKNLVLSQHVFALMGVLGTDNNLAIMPFITQQKVPLIFPLTGSSKVIRPLRKYIFTYEVSYTVEGTILTDYAVKKLGAKNIAVFYQNDDFGKEGLNAITAQAKVDGAAIVAADSYNLTDLNMTAQVQDAVQANADAVIMFAVPPSAALYLVSAHIARYKGRVLSTSVAADPILLKTLKGMASGLYFDAWLPDPQAKTAQMATYRSILARYAKGMNVMDPSIEGGMAAAQVLVEGLKRAGRNLTRESLAKAMESVHNWNGGIAPNVTYSATKHDGPEGAYMAQQNNGLLIPLGAYIYPKY